MIKAKLNNGDIILGLSRKNIALLQEGRPIKFNLKDMGLEDRTVLIVFGETEESLYEAMLPLIDLNKTKLHFPPKGDEQS